MRQNSTLKKMNSYLCIIYTLKFRTRFRVTITRALAGALRIRTCDRSQVHTYVSTRCHIQKVPQLPNWPLLQLTTSTYIGSSAAYVVTMYTSGSGTGPLAKSWDLLASGTTRTIATLWRCAVQHISKGAYLGEL